MLQRVLDSLKETTHHPDSIEVILVTDSDDREMANFSYFGLQLQRLEISPGRTMGELNMAGYAVATGEYIFLLNDDVIARTTGWDSMIAEALKSFPDGVVMIHVNDKLFHDSLCTFPLLPRSLCEVMGGICRTEYIRYRIDDHIHNVFDLLALLGHRRIIYMEEVVFEHLNRLTGADGTSRYVPNEAIQARDTIFFDNQLPARKELAVRLVEHIDAFAQQNLRDGRANRLLPITDSVAIRDPRHARRYKGSTTLCSANTKVTVGVISTDIRSEHSRRCLEQLKQNSQNFDLIVLEVCNGPEFSHAREINRMLTIANNEFIVVMSDDVFVEPGWLDEMLKVMNPTIGMVTPGHKNPAGDFVYGGIVMRPDQSGHYTHIFSTSLQPRPVQTISSALFLLDLAKCGHLRVGEQYERYFFDIEFGLQVWEAGFQVVCLTSTVVTHTDEGTFDKDGELSDILYEHQRLKFVKAWIETGRYWKLESSIWRDIPELQALVEHPGLVGEMLNAASLENRKEFQVRTENYCTTFGPYPALLEFAEAAAAEIIAKGECEPESFRQNLNHFIAECGQRRARNPQISSSRRPDSNKIAPWQGSIVSTKIPVVPRSYKTPIET